MPIQFSYVRTKYFHPRKIQSSTSNHFMYYKIKDVNPLPKMPINLQQNSSIGGCQTCKRWLSKWLLHAQSYYARVKQVWVPKKGQLLCTKFTRSLKDPPYTKPRKATILEHRKINFTFRYPRCCHHIKHSNGYLKHNHQELRK